MGKMAVIRTSPHEKGNTNILADAFIKGAKDAGNDIVDIDINEYRLNFCRGCYGTGNEKACTACGVCWQQDDANRLCSIIRTCDAIIFATPVYFYSVSGQMKVFIDRTVQLYGAEYRFRSIYLLAASESGSKTAVDGAVKVLQGWIDCMPGTSIAGVVCGTGALAPGAVGKDAVVLKEAEEMGRKAGR